MDHKRRAALYKEWLTRDNAWYEVGDEVTPTDSTLKDYEFLYPDLYERLIGQELLTVTEIDRGHMGPGEDLLTFAELETTLYSYEVMPKERRVYETKDGAVLVE